MTDVRVVTCLELPEPDADEAPLVEALSREGLAPELAAWDDASIPWTDGTLAIVRSPWNYHHDLPRFLAWADSVGAALVNSPDVVRWNTHKRYLAELAGRGVPTAPTVLVDRAAPRTVTDIVGETRWNELVVKPAVSAGSYMTERFTTADLAAAEEHLGRIVVERDALVQAYLPSVEAHGERSLVWIDGAFTHAVRKNPRFGEDPESVTGPLDITLAERTLGHRALGACGFGDRLLYARVDMAPGPDGTPVLMELELTEPSLFFAQHPPALARFARSVKSRAEDR